MTSTPAAESTHPTPGAAIVIAGAPNLRDLGGWATADGARIRYGQVYRSTDLSRLHDADRAAFAALDIGTVFDLRTTAEMTGQPDALPAGVRSVHLDVLADSAVAPPASLQTLLENPSAITEFLGGGKATDLMADAYRDIVRLPSALTSYTTLFTELADPDLGPALFHCTTGKDRTGWASASLLTLLGVDHEAVLQEYLLTNTELLPALQPMLDAFAVHGGDPELLLPILGVEAEYLEAAFDQMRTDFDDIEGYFTTGLGLDRATLDALAAKLVE